MKSTVYTTGWENTLPVDGPLPVVSQLLITNFNHFQRHSRIDCRLRWATLRLNQRLVAAAPVVQLPRCPIPLLLNTAWRKRLSWLNPFLTRNIVLVDTSFMGYLAISPILTMVGMDASLARQQLCEFIWAELAPDSLTVSEPAQRACLVKTKGWDHYTTLPIALIDLSSQCSFDGYVGSLSQKRRRNLRKEQQAFRAASGKIEQLEGPLKANSAIVHGLIDCLKASERRARIVAPYNSVMIDQDAFANQRQTLFVAWINDKIVGFISVLKNGHIWLQVHGGFDYQQSLAGYTYHNLIYHAIEQAIKSGAQGILMGPLNNEAKRRASTVLVPMVNSVRQRSPFDRLLSKWWIYKRLGVYLGPFETCATTKTNPTQRHPSEQLAR